MVCLLQRDYLSAQRRGFRKAIQRLQWEWEDWDRERLDGEEKPTWHDFLDWGEAWKGGIIPDLWFVDEECMSVICIEVEDTSRINTAKLDQYICLWWHLDEMYWETHLICSDRWGNLSPVPLTDFTPMGMVDIANHRKDSLIRVEREAKLITFELTRIYSIRNREEREDARRKWLEKYPRFGLRTNPNFNHKSFLRRRGIVAA